MAKPRRFSGLQNRLSHGRHRDVGRSAVRRFLAATPLVSDSLISLRGCFVFFGFGALSHALLCCQHLVEDVCLDLDGPVDDAQLLLQESQSVLDSPVRRLGDDVRFLTRQCPVIVLDGVG